MNNKQLKINVDSVLDYSEQLILLIIMKSMNKIKQQSYEH